MNRDLFLSYNSHDRETVARIQRSLADRGITTFYDRDDLKPGRPWFDDLETALRSSRAAAIFVGKNGLGSIQKREMQFALMRQATAEKEAVSFPVIPVILDGSDIDAIAGFLALNTWVDLRPGSDNNKELDRLASATMHREVESTNSVQICPYRGLQVFREEDAPLFFGREVFCKKLLKHVVEKRVVFVVGPSGVGKSSVMQAGLLPHIRAYRPPSQTWDVIVSNPGHRPFHSIANGLVALWSAPDRTNTQILAEAEDLGVRLASGAIRLASAVEMALTKLANTDRLLVVIDHFEQLLMSGPNDVERAAFLNQLFDATVECPVTILTALRADSLTLAMKLGRSFVEHFEEGSVVLGPPRQDELRRIIEQPAVSMGLHFEAGLVDRILADVEMQPGALPLLEFALAELWRARSSVYLTHSAYDRIGGIAGAIACRAQFQLSTLSPDLQAEVPRVLSRLVFISSDETASSDSRRSANLNEFDQNGRAIVESFATARLLVLNQFPVSDSATAELAHEVLLYKWPLLREWLDQNREFLRWRQRLGLFASEWLHSHCDDGSLIRGPMLAEAQEWGCKRPADFSEQETGFIQASLHARRRIRTLTFAGIAFSILMIGVLAFNLLLQHKRGGATTVDIPVMERSKQQDLELMIEADHLYEKTLYQMEHGNESEALRFADQMLAACEQLRTHILNQGLRERFTLVTKRQYELSIRLLMQMSERLSDRRYAERALEISEKAHSTAIIEMLSENATDIRRRANQEILQRYQTLRDSFDTSLAELISLRLDASTPQSVIATKQAEIDRQLQELQKVQQEIRETGAQHDAIVQPHGLKVAQIQQLLDKDTLLLEFSLGADRSFAWVVSKTTVQSYRLPKRSAIEAAANEVMVKATGRPAPVEAAIHPVGFGIELVDPDFAYWRAASTLSNMIFSHRLQLSSVKRLVIVPDGALQNIPFSALPISLNSYPNQLDSKRRELKTLVPLLTQYEVITIPSVSVLATLRARPLKSFPASKGAIVIADPVFESSDARVRKPSGQLPIASIYNGVRMPRMMFTRHEAMAVREILTRGQVMTAVDFTANRGTVMAPELSKYRIIHFATLAFADPEHPELSALVLSSVDADGRPKNGVVSLIDIHDLNLSAELVVLNGCRTTEISRAFMDAGVKRIIGAVGSIDDQAAAELIIRFYKHLNAGYASGAALRFAQLELLKSPRWKSPHYWGGFVLEGDWE